MEEILLYLFSTTFLESGFYHQTTESKNIFKHFLNVLRTFFKLS